MRIYFLVGAPQLRICESSEATGYLHAIVKCLEGYSRAVLIVVPNSLLFVGIIVLVSLAISSLVFGPQRCS
jgi:hypothetical protein